MRIWLFFCFALSVVALRGHRGGYRKKKRSLKQNTVAVAAVVTRFNNAKVPSEFRDSLALLAQSIIDVNARSKWKLVPVALCIEGAIAEEAEEVLKVLGYEVVMKPHMLTKQNISKDARSDFKSQLQDAEDNLHSFGGVLQDLHKLWGMTLTEYDRVLIMDVDTMLFEPLDDVFELSKDFSLTSTIDWGMVQRNGRFPPIQTGFLLFNPALTAQQVPEILSIYKRGQWSQEMSADDKEYVPTQNGGWERSDVGSFYGGATTAGILSYYYLQHLPGAAVGSTETIYDYVTFTPADPLTDIKDNL